MSNYLDNLEIFDPKAISKGRTIYKQRKVTFSSSAPNAVEATVFGDSPCSVHLLFDADNDLVSATCDCPTPGFCEHMVAAIYEASDQFGKSEDSGEEGAEKEKSDAAARAVEDVKNSVFRFNYKGLSKSMETFTALLVKSSESGKITAIKLLFLSFLSKGKYPIEYERLTPYIKEIIKRSGLEKDKLEDLFYEILGENIGSEALWRIMNADKETSIPFQKAAYRRVKEGMNPPFHLSSSLPPATWASVDPKLLDELLDVESFSITEADMAQLIRNAEARKDPDDVIGLFQTALKNFDSFILDPKVLEFLSSSDEHRRKLEKIFYDEFLSSPTPEKYLLWRSVALDGDFISHLPSFLEVPDLSTKDFILLKEGRKIVGDAYDGLDVRNVPFNLLTYAAKDTEEERVKNDLLDYCEEEESGILRDLDRRCDDLTTLLSVYSRFGHEQLKRLLGNPMVDEKGKEDAAIRGRLLLAAYHNDLLPILGVKAYKE